MERMRILETFSGDETGWDELQTSTFYTFASGNWQFKFSILTAELS